MELGAFSVSLAVQDIEASKLFYEKLGFTVFAGDQSQVTVQLGDPHENRRTHSDVGGLPHWKTNLGPDDMHVPHFFGAVRIAQMSVLLSGVQ